MRTKQVNHHSNGSILNLSSAFTDHPIVWLDPLVYNSQNQTYTSIEQAKCAYNQEKLKIISCYERQLQVQHIQFITKQFVYLNLSKIVIRC